MKKTKIISITGPTASGKTALAIGLAKRIGAQIVSCDSMQIYKYLEIGTAKPTAEERAEVKHHLIDFVDPRDNYSCASYVDDAKATIATLGSNGIIPLFCGGTGLYIDSLVSGTDFSDAGSDDAYREELSAFAEKNGNAALFDLLKKIDPESAAKTHENNVKRVIRALEIHHVTGKTKSYWDSVSRTSESPYDELRFVIDFKDRNVLYSRIDSRVDAMFDKGLFEEVKSLSDSGILVRGTTAAQAIGYKEIIDVIDGLTSLDEANALVKKNTRNYAKRQLTWFRRGQGGVTVFADEPINYEYIVNICESYLIS